MISPFVSGLWPRPTSPARQASDSPHVGWALRRNHDPTLALQENRHLIIEQQIVVLHALLPSN